MAIDLYPYSERDDGEVTDSEHERLWLTSADGILPYEPADSLAVEFAGGQWTTRPGRLLICGHVLHADTDHAGDLPRGAAFPQRCVLTASLDRTTTPWTYGLELLQGRPGAGRPPLERTLDGRYQVPLRAVDIAPDGGITPLRDERVRLNRTGALPPAVEAAQAENQATTSASWQNGDQLCELTFIAPASGRVLVHTYARAAGSTRPPASALVAFSLRRGGPEGPVVRTPTAEDGPTIQGGDETGLSVVKRITGLEPFEQYYARVAHRSGTSGVRIQVSHRRLLVQPLEA